MYAHPDQAGRCYQSTTQGKTNTAAPNIHTIDMVQYNIIINIELVKVLWTKIACKPLISTVTVKHGYNEVPGTDDYASL